MVWSRRPEREFEGALTSKQAGSKGPVIVGGTHQMLIMG